MQLSDTIDRRSNLSQSEFEREYLLPLRPVIVTDGIDHWGALGRWTPQFFKQNYGHLEVEVDGDRMMLGDLIDRVEASTPEKPAPYLHNQPLSKWPPELAADVTPMPECTKPNWLTSRVFPKRGLSSVEAYIGGQGAEFPVMHWDGLHTHAFLMQVYGDKEYIVFAPDQTEYMYPNGVGSNRSQIKDLLNYDREQFPLFEQAQGTRFQLHPGETLFVPSGWWHTARILSPSVTVSINGVNKANGRAFREDFCASLAERSSLQSSVVRAGLMVGEATRLFELV